MPNGPLRKSISMAKETLFLFQNDLIKGKAIVVTLTGEKKSKQQDSTNKELLPVTGFKFSSSFLNYFEP